MPKVTVFDKKGNQVEDIKLSQEIFGVTVNPVIMHQAVVAQLNAKRRGTVSTKTRGEVQGRKGKPWRQKGTGRARHGSVRSPIWVGGGVTFGPKSKTYQNRLPKKVKKQAVRSALTAKVADNKFFVLEELKMEQPKTKEMVALLESLQIENEKILFLLERKDENVYKSLRNLPKVRPLISEAINIYDIVNNEYIVATREAVVKMEEVLAP